MGGKTLFVMEENKMLMEATGKEVIEGLKNTMVGIYEGYEKLCTEGKIEVNSYLEKLKSARGIVPVHEFYRRLHERGQITEGRYQTLLQEREVYLNDLLNNNQTEENKK